MSILNGSLTLIPVIIQVSTSDHVYIWILHKFLGFLHGLGRLLKDSSVTKVGCGLRTRDLYKLQISGLTHQPSSNKLPEGLLIYKILKLYAATDAFALSICQSWLAFLQKVLVDLQLMLKKQEAVG